MTPERDEILDLCAGYVLGALDDADRLRVDELVARRDPETLRALAEFGDASLALAVGAPAVRPDPALKGRVLAAIASTPRAQAAVGEETAARGTRREALRPARFPFFGALGWGAAAVLAFAWMSERNAARRLGEELAAMEESSREMESALADERVWTESMSSSDAKVATFSPMPDAPATLEGWAVFDPDTRRAVLVFENMEPPADRDFELWAIREGGPESLGVIQIGEGGRAFLRLADISDAAKVGAFAISLEAKGGSPSKTAPAGPVVMVGEL